MCIYFLPGRKLFGKQGNCVPFGFILRIMILNTIQCMFCLRFMNYVLDGKIFISLFAFYDSVVY